MGMAIKAEAVNPLVAGSSPRMRGESPAGGAIYLLDPIGYDKFKSNSRV